MKLLSPDQEIIADLAIQALKGLGLNGMDGMKADAFHMELSEGGPTEVRLDVRFRWSRPLPHCPKTSERPVEDASRLAE